ncbi:MAG: CHAP domain-containing protein [Gemmatimonadota bacterium]|nr:MAG: CHAP domain-containing protein [Gemmatimonadota bacterium]
MSRTRAVASAAAIIAGLLAILMPRTTRRESCPERYRRAVVRAAAGEMGQGDPDRITEYIVDAVGHDPRGPRGHLHWCGIFALWALHRAGLGTSIRWKIGRGFLGHLPSTRDPQPGDIAYFTKNQHHAVVERVNGDGTFDAINGNGTGGVVTRSTGVALSKAKSFESIQPLIDEVCS